VLKKHLTTSKTAKNKWGLGIISQFPIPVNHNRSQESGEIDFGFWILDFGLFLSSPP
jgi:hypothetical protein